MRIIGGKYRGKNLISPLNSKVRPTSDRAREALFNILRSRLGFNFSQYKLLDLFAGSGAFALEAISQGFAEVAMVDLDPQPLMKNVALFPTEKNKIKIIKGDAVKLGPAPQSYEVLFCDAPYQQGLTDKTLSVVSANKWLSQGALCLIEVAKDEECRLPDGFVLSDIRRYGAAKVIIAEWVG